MIISPGEYVQLVYQISDPSDPATYYVQAKIRNSKTNTTITTVNLTDRGSGRFTGEWQASEDSGGNGTWVDIEITVYTNSGYTTKSENYEVDSKQYIIQYRTTTHFGGGGGGSVSYEKIREIVREERGEVDKVDLSEIIKLLKKIMKFLVKHEAMMKKLDRSTEIISALADLSEDIAKIPTDKTDLAPVVKMVGDRLDRMGSVLKVADQDIVQLREKVNMLVQVYGQELTPGAKKMLESMWQSLVHSSGETPAKGRTRSLLT